MPAPATVVLNNGTTNLTFTLVDNIHGVATYQFRVDGRPDLAYQLKLTNPRNATGRKGSAELTVPISRSVDGVQTRVDLVREKFLIPIPDTATGAERIEAVALAKAVMASASVTDYFANSVGV